MKAHAHLWLWDMLLFPHVRSSGSLSLTLEGEMWEDLSRPWAFSLWQRGVLRYLHINSPQFTENQSENSCWHLNNLPISHLFFITRLKETRLFTTHQKRKLHSTVWLVKFHSVMLWTVSWRNSWEKTLPSAFPLLWRHSYAFTVPQTSRFMQKYFKVNIFCLTQI